ncbi:MAG: phosphatidylserine decarboxylase family protein [Thermoplasmata archaeon]|nr:phosphatidylserine decarboxylase family protein [Thermoplasmata archaeon]NIS11533.1 phosphatidylserine decarboxylase family protein [Thermoplasmata archaeon]NIS19451.1 phosphatidylserine decarboxylase family protein [Thermoplasmata archaeon]NIT76576.1 phosphatidylserine decarboxylase family protein [Thermoplasmata archaeon]NIU48569.1 phosphatidylserine decarboxylase family protein [Thermoplasmata archaeon]
MLAKGTPWPIYLLPIFIVGFSVPWYRAGFPYTLLYLAILAPLLVFTFLVFYFFRDPERPTAEGLVAPAHGRVLGVFDEDGRTRVSTFMSPLNVHVIRAPLDGRVKSMEWSGSGFYRAFKPEADHNVQVRIEFEGGEVPFTVVMISGWIARRIVPYLTEGDTVTRGSRMGLIRFGSRVDVIVPQETFRIDVKEGDIVRAGSSSLGVRAG